jgi:hypothetical protein
LLFESKVAINNQIVRGQDELVNDEFGPLLQHTLHIRLRCYRVLREIEFLVFMRLTDIGPIVGLRIDTTLNAGKARTIGKQIFRQAGEGLRIFFALALSPRFRRRRKKAQQSHGQGKRRQERTLRIESQHEYFTLHTHEDTGDAY